MFVSGKFCEIVYQLDVIRSLADEFFVFSGEMLSKILRRLILWLI